jgi:aminomethyltransferase
MFFPLTKRQFRELAEMDEFLTRTHLHQFHRQNAKMFDFVGFYMPLWYKGIIPEHLAVRTRVGLFDTTHMGRALISGARSEDFLNYLTTNDVSRLEPLGAQYSTMCNEHGGIKDDLILFRLDQDQFFMVYNAVNREKDYKWIAQHSGIFDGKVEDVSDNIAMFALQGPNAQQTLQKIANVSMNTVERFKCRLTKVADINAFVSRTGYTGEDGFEIFVWETPLSEPAKAIRIWDAILNAGNEFGIEPCGLGARDTLRLEAGLCLYGNDIDETTTPLEAGLNFVVKRKKEPFIGKDALIKQKAQGIKRKLVGLRALEKGILRPNQEVWKNNTLRIGYVTSGTFSPLLKSGIGMAYVAIEYTAEGEVVTVKVRDKSLRAEIAKLPFYEPSKYGYLRQT